jgi:hypothetical protein
MLVSSNGHHQPCVRARELQSADVPSANGVHLAGKEGPQSGACIMTAHSHTVRELVIGRSKFV